MRFRAPFLPRFFPHFSPPLSPSGPVHSPTTSPPLTSPFILPFLTPRKLRFRYPSDLLGVQTPSLFCVMSWGLFRQFSGNFGQSAWPLFGYFQAISGNFRQFQAIFRRFRAILGDYGGARTQEKNQLKLTKIRLRIAHLRFRYSLVSC